MEDFAALVYGLGSGYFEGRRLPPGYLSMAVAVKGSCILGISLVNSICRPILRMRRHIERSSEQEGSLSPGMACGEGATSIWRRVTGGKATGSRRECAGGSGKDVVAHKLVTQQQVISHAIRWTTGIFCRFEVCEILSYT